MLHCLRASLHSAISLRLRQPRAAEPRYLRSRHPPPFPEMAYDDVGCNGCITRRKGLPMSLPGYVTSRSFPLAPRMRPAATMAGQRIRATRRHGDADSARGRH